MLAAPVVRLDVRSSIQFGERGQFLSGVVAQVAEGAESNEDHRGWGGPAQPAKKAGPPMRSPRFLRGQQRRFSAPMRCRRLFYLGFRDRFLSHGGTPLPSARKTGKPPKAAHRDSLESG